MDAARELLGVAVAGVGFFGALRASAARYCWNTRLVGVYDRDRDQAGEVASRLKTTAFRTFDDLLRSSEVGAVVIATPHADHVAQAATAIRAGKHVLCEKPLTIDAADARTLAMLADECKVRLATGFNHRYFPPVCDALTLVSSWAIGRVESVRIEIGHMATLEFLEGWHADPKRSGGGSFIDNGPHACDLVRKFMGEVTAVKAYVQDVIGLPEGCESEAYALFRNHDRAIAEVRSSWTLPRGYLTIEIRGGQGWLRVETAPWRLVGKLADGRSLAHKYTLARARERLIAALSGCESSLISELGDFAERDLSRLRANATGWDGSRVAEMVQAAYESAHTGMEVELQPPIVHTPHQPRRSSRSKSRTRSKEVA